jgi:hypothetical protein
MMVSHPGIILQSSIDRRPYRLTGVLVEVINWEEMRSFFAQRQPGSIQFDNWKGIIARHEGLVDLNALGRNEDPTNFVPRIQAERINLPILRAGTPFSMLPNSYTRWFLS